MELGQAPVLKTFSILLGQSMTTAMIVRTVP